jgi:hypothetical protein
MSRSSLYDFRDLDLLVKLEREADAEGWIEAEYLAEAMGMSLNGGGLLHTGLPSRLTWMRRYGMLDYDEKKRMWRLTGGAQRVIEARLRSATKKQLEALPDESMIEVMANVHHRYRHGDPMMAAMLRREFRYGTGLR